MRNLYIFNNASRASGYGIGTFLRQLSAGMAAFPGWKVTVVDLMADVKDFTVTTDAQGITHHQIPALPMQAESASYCRSAFHYVARNLCDGQAEEETVFHFNYYQHLPLAMALKSRYPCARIVLTVHYLGWCFELDGNLTRLRAITAKGHEPQDDKERRVLSSMEQEREFLHLADSVVVLSRATREILIADYKTSPEKLHLVYNGLGDGPSPVAERIDTAGESRDILFVGRLDEIKGLKYLISAFARIAARHPGSRLVIAGDGDFQPYLRQSGTLPGRVVFLGRLEVGEMEEAYRRACIGVMPSFHEQCSYTAIEMMRHGLPVIGTDSTGLSEMLDANPDLRVPIREEDFSEEDFVSAIAARLDTLLSDECAHLRASRANLRLYAERYTATVMTESTRRVLETTLPHIISADWLPHIDGYMIQLINRHPDIDAEFFGMSGIGVYLWWRVRSLGTAAEGVGQSMLVQEHLIYLLDWLQETRDGAPLPWQMTATLQDMLRAGFYKTRVRSLLAGAMESATQLPLPSETETIHNALRICNCKI
ncbi:MAG: glycosyltransferase [Bacteroidaceae bacterium]|nr:glycosyltransferase [Bacteroidaceae bacterium]